MKKKSASIISIVLFFVVFIGIRFLYLNTTLWYDEACSWYSASQNFPFGILDNLLTLDLQHSPLYFFVLHFWMKIFGQGELALRLLSLIFGVLSVPLAYVVARKISSKTIAIFSTCVVAFSPLLSLFSVEVRMYPMVIFLVLLSVNYLVDYENSKSKSDLLKLIIVNILIPYTYVGGILYNISLLVCYGYYLYKSKSSVLKKYLSYEIIEYLSLIPFFMLIGFYAVKRHIFVVMHEGSLSFSQIIDIIRNFFGATLVPNIYWPSTDGYNMTLWFTLLVIVPCVYFVYGFIKGCFKSEKFEKVLYNIFGLCFIFFVVCAFFRINVLTVRYLLYLLPVMFILSVVGLFRNLSSRLCKIFLSLFVVCSICFSLYNVPRFRVMKGHAFKAVSIEAAANELGNDDIVIMPFGADAPYYFRNFESPVVFDFDFHKQVRNPYNEKYYDPSMSNIMKSSQKYDFVAARINEDSVFSHNFENYFMQNINQNVQSGRYVLLAMYGGDANSIAPVDTLRALIKDEKYLHHNFVDVMFRKFLCDVIAMLNRDFSLVKLYEKGNYTYYLFKKN